MTPGPNRIKSEIEGKEAYNNSLHAYQNRILETFYIKSWLASFLNSIRTYQI